MILDTSGAGSLPTPVTVPPSHGLLFPVNDLESTPSPNFPVGARLLPAPTKSKWIPEPPGARSQEDKSGHGGLWARPLHARGKEGVEKL